MTRGAIIILALAACVVSSAHANEVKSHHLLGCDTKSGDWGSLVGQLVVIPGGKFLMGTDEDVFDPSEPDTQWNQNEQPAHWVEVEPFMMQEHEVTWDQYQPCIDAGVCPSNDYETIYDTPDRKYGGDAGWGKGDRPVGNVSYDAIVGHYIPWLKQKTGFSFRLPSEAEWEYASLAAGTTDFSWGDEVGNGNANCGVCGSQWDGQSTAPVKSFPPNSYGLYNMHGNVAEWVQDCRNDSYNGAPSDGEPWMSGDCEFRVTRGGDFRSDLFELRNKFRSAAKPELQDRGIGFRLAKECSSDE